MGKEYAEKYQENRKRFLQRVFYAQRTTSVNRKHSPPEYTSEEFVSKFENDPVFVKLHSNWLAQNKDGWSKPSFDRLNDTKGYSFNNIRLVTWKENHSKQKELEKIRVLVYSESGSKWYPDKKSVLVELKVWDTQLGIRKTDQEGRSYHEITLREGIVTTSRKFKRLDK